jgi:hypothetical protein
MGLLVSKPRDRMDFTEAFDWASAIEEEDASWLAEPYAVDPADEAWLVHVQETSTLTSDTIRRYSQDEVAWVEFYTIEPLGKRYQGTCTLCGVSYVRGTLKTLREVLQRHVMRGCQSDPVYRSSESTGECPF